MQRAAGVNRAVLGIDIGTTNISAVVIGMEQNAVLETQVIQNVSKLPAEDGFSEYDAHWIAGRVKMLTDRLTDRYPGIAAIGLTGQMHGVLYVDEMGRAVSPLYNWQDRRGNRAFRQDVTYCDEIYIRTGCRVFPGYGFATLFYNQHNGLAPKAGKKFCSIMDYAAMVLTGGREPLVHPSNGAAFGLYDVRNNCFDGEAVEKLGLSRNMLPRIARDGDLVGLYRGIPVVAAIGDNQAGFYGSVSREATDVLVNFGTGSQISAVVNRWQHADESLEIRPYLFGKYLLCGSALCGGKAYSVLEDFFSRYAEALTGKTGAQYEVMNGLAMKAYPGKRRLKVATQFSGTRQDPSLRGAVWGIDTDNFTPENLILGVLQGMVDELKTYFDCMGLEHMTRIVGAGNGLQKNPVLQMLLQDTFRLPLVLADRREEAATGAALYAGVANGIMKSDQAEITVTYRKGHLYELGKL